MIELKRIDQEQDLKAAYSIREKVFVIEQQVPADAEYDQYEGTAKHYLATCEGVPCGAARWRVTDKGIKLERFAVLAEYRNKNVGAKLLEAVLQDVRKEHAAKEIYLHAQLPAVNFYKRHGFATEGDMFSECDIQHYKMIFKG
ncbi:GNAT family N-acetyltransferase [Pontibacter diazotrophicus]|uniref:GNAT family N-acetyltransferase n=1 Tax=Pontibacter diazotrophicus TaxID=1400979 RepID=A0A3D8LEM3_9BACT|nr:GNAT family N-acetyltransferase [Pontibacter diazotrophicus]RDV15850.1 GNAT family N-acetyltransferase [Pontibacter diazotrophicus]